MIRLEKNVRLYLIWSRRSGETFVEDFLNYDGLNGFLQRLDSDDIVSVRVVAGMLLEERVGD